MEKESTIEALPARVGWRDAVQTLRAQRTSQVLLGGSLIMLIGSTVVSAVNFGYNVTVARLLGPAAFGHTSVAVTLLMLASAITLSFQLVCAKFVAKNESAGAKARVYRVLRARSWVVGIPLGIALAAASPFIAAYLHLPSAWLVVLLACGIAFYVPLGVKRGAMQGTCAFPRLTSNLIGEAAVKFLGALILVEAGFGVTGAVAAIAASVIVAYFVPRTGNIAHTHPEACEPASFREGIQAIVFFVGQVLINNIDILLVKHFFPPREAGLYAAVALVGRVLYFAAWSVVSAMFPVSAGAKPKDRNLNVLVLPLIFVLSISVVFILLLFFFPSLVIHIVFGAGFREAEPLLSLYAATTGAYALSVVLMAYEMSRRIANTGWLQLAFSGLVVVGISLFHASLREVILVQLVLMVFLLIAVSIPFFRPGRELAALQEAA